MFAWKKKKNKKEKKLKECWDRSVPSESEDCLRPTRERCRRRPWRRRSGPARNSSGCSRQTSRDRRTGGYHRWPGRSCRCPTGTWTTSDAGDGGGDSWRGRGCRGGRPDWTRPSSCWNCLDRVPAPGWAPRCNPWPAWASWFSSTFRCSPTTRNWTTTSWTTSWATGCPTGTPRFPAIFRVFLLLWFFGKCKYWTGGDPAATMAQVFTTDGRPSERNLQIKFRPAAGNAFSLCCCSGCKTRPSQERERERKRTAHRCVSLEKEKSARHTWGMAFRSVSKAWLISFMRDRSRALAVFLRYLLSGAGFCLGLGTRLTCCTCCFNFCSTSSRLAMDRGRRLYFSPSSNDDDDDNLFRFIFCSFCVNFCLLLSLHHNEGNVCR